MSHQFTKEQMKSLDSLQPNFHAVIQRLEDVIAPDIIEQLKAMQKKVADLMAPYNESEENDWQANFEALDIIQQEHKFSTVWSVSEVPASKINELTPNMKHMEYKGATVIIPGAITWLNAWKIANSLIKQSGDSHHIFIEDFEPTNGGVKLITGS